MASTYDYVGGPDDDDTSSNLFKYAAPDLCGWSAEPGHTFRDDPGGNDKWDMNLAYDDGPASAGPSLDKTGHDQAGYAPGGQHDFGAVAVAASYNDNRGLRRGVSLGARTGVGPFSIALDLTRDTRHGPGSSPTAWGCSTIPESPYCVAPSLPPTHAGQDAEALNTIFSLPQGRSHARDRGRSPA